MNVIEVVADKANPSPNDVWVHDRLVAKGHTVTYVSDSDALPSMAGVGLVVVGIGVNAANIAKYDPIAVGVLSLGAAEPHTLFSSGANGGGSATTSYYVTAPNSDPIAPNANGSNQTFLGSTPGTIYRFFSTSGLGSGAVVVAQPTSSLARAVIARYDAGAILSDGSTAAPSRRTYYSIIDPTLTNATGQAWFDNAVTWTAATTANQAPTASLPPSFGVSVGEAFSITATDSDADGTIASRQWRLVSSPSGTALPLTGATTQTVSGTAPSTTGDYVLGYQVTDDKGATSVEQTITMTVALPGQYARPVGDTSTGGWRGVAADGSSSPTLYTCIDDATPDATDYIESPDTPTHAIYEFPLSPLPDPGTDTGIELDLMPWITSAVTSHTLVVRLIQYDATAKTDTVVASRSFSNLTTSANVLTVAFTAAEIAGITDWQNARVSLDATAA